MHYVLYCNFQTLAASSVLSQRAREVVSRWCGIHVKTSGGFYRNSGRFGLSILRGSGATGGQGAAVKLDEFGLIRRKAFKNTLLKNSTENGR